MRMPNDRASSCSSASSSTFLLEGTAVSSSSQMASRGVSLSAETREALDVRVAESGDLTDGALSSFLFWKLPAVVVVGVALLDVGSVGQALVWAPSLAIGGAACVANILRCRRIHCYFTGPFFLLMAAVSLLHGVGALPLGEEGWTWIELVTLIGAIALGTLPELVWGRYWAPRPGAN